MTDLRQPLTMTPDLMIARREGAGVIFSALARFGRTLFAGMMEARQRQARDVLARYSDVIERTHTSSSAGGERRAGGDAR